MKLRRLRYLKNHPKNEEWVTIRLTDEAVAQLAEIAAALGITKNDAANLALRRLQQKQLVSEVKAAKSKGGVLCSNSVGS